jgi:hypothetical protein
MPLEGELAVLNKQEGNKRGKRRHLGKLYSLLAFTSINSSKQATATSTFIPPPHINHTMSPNGVEIKGLEQFKEVVSLLMAPEQACLTTA